MANSPDSSLQNKYHLKTAVAKGRKEIQKKERVQGQGKQNASILQG